MSVHPPVVGSPVGVAKSLRPADFDSRPPFQSPNGTGQGASHLRSATLKTPDGGQRFFVLLSLVATLTACASAPGGNIMRTAGTTGGILITVQNDNYWDATIHANWGGPRERLGFVVGKTTETFTFTPRRQEVQFEVTFTGDGAWRTERIVVYPGDHLDLKILPGPSGRMAPGLTSSSLDSS